MGYHRAPESSLRGDLKVTK
ncbi:uncharacterized protein G2W53_037247 [Senna tora]|uniref:Uncharacterized protein n=1 Tax=Senna tora TaxID=362788 RepID=A0A834SV07_9FABA|nr:uncharacterized protein G2W53_037247 [Senna tora]